MTHHLDMDRDKSRAKASTALDKRREQIFAAAFQRALNDENTRFVLNAFFANIDLDGSAFHPHGSHQSHNIGMHDAGKWWVNAIRAHCPEREAQLRIEARNAALAIVNEEAAE